MAPTELYAQRVGNADAALPPDICAFSDSFAIIFSRLRQGYGGPREKPIHLCKDVMRPQRTHSIGAGNPYGRRTGVGRGFGEGVARGVTTSNCAIIPSSACSIMWQWSMYMPV